MILEDISQTEECACRAAQALTDYLLHAWQKGGENTLWGVSGFEGGKIGMYEACLKVISPFFFEDKNICSATLLSSFSFLLSELEPSDVFTKLTNHPSSLVNDTGLQYTKLIKDLTKKYEKANTLYQALPSNQDHQAKAERDEWSTQIIKAKQENQTAKLVSTGALVDVLSNILPPLFESLSRIHKTLPSQSGDIFQRHLSQPDLPSQNEDVFQNRLSQRRKASPTSF